MRITVDHQQFFFLAGKFIRARINPRSAPAGQTGVETAIATARPFLGVRASSLGLQKALGALYNFAAGREVVGCKPGPQRADEVGNHRGTWGKA